LIKGLHWAINTGIWNVSEKNFASNGVVNIKG